MPNPSNSQRNIALSFSGGGFRAAGFALGTMVLLDKIGWMERVNIISSASGGSITNAFFVATKAKFYSDHQMTFNQENFLDKFYRPLKAFLESDEVTNAILSDVGGQDKIIKKAAFCYEEYLKEILDSVDSTEIIEDIWQLLERNNTSPDCLSINATDMTDANLFRFAILRTQNTNHGLILGNTFFDLSKMENNNPKLKNYLQTLKIGDTIAASSCFPIGFEPMIFPDDFFTGDCLQEGLENQKSVALMDGGLYDNLALTSLESLRPNSKNQEITLSGQIDLVIVTDADNLEPSRALLDPEKLKEVNESHSSAQQLSRFQKILSWLTKVGIKLVDYIIKIFKGYQRGIQLLVSILGIKYEKTKLKNEKSWKLLNYKKIVELIKPRLLEIAPTFGALFTRNRNLTYQFLENVENLNNNEERILNYLVCLAKLATALPTTLWLKWYTICSVKRKGKMSNNLIDEILRDESTCIWQTEANPSEMSMNFGTQPNGTTKSTAAEVVIACGFVAACYNLLEYSANKIGVLYTESEIYNDPQQKMQKLKKLKTDRNNPQCLNLFAEQFDKKLNELDLKNIDQAASIWWEIMSFSPSASSDEENLHDFIKHIHHQIERVNGL